MKINFNLMNKLGTAALLMGSLACVPLKSDLEDSTLKSSAKSIEFKDFCRQAALENCDINYLTHIKDSSWDAGIDTFSEVMRSESFLHFSRSTFSQNSVKSLVNTLGGQGVIAFVDRIPWDSISMSQMDESITLKNEKYNTQASFNGLTFIAKKVAQITPAGNRRFNVSGINLLTNLGLEQIYQIDLNDPAVMHFETDQGWINNIPVNYFYLEDQMMAKRKEFTPGDLVEAISDVHSSVPAAGNQAYGYGS